MSVIPAITYDDPNAAIEFLERAFGFQPTLLVTDDDAVAQELLRERFGIQVAEFDCGFTYTFWDTPQPLPATLANTVVARGCTRRRRVATSLDAGGPLPALRRHQ